MHRTIGVGMVGLLIGALGCTETSAPSAATEQIFEPGFDMTTPPTGGACPNYVWYETTETLNNGATVTWRSAFGVFDYMFNTPYAVAQLVSASNGPAVSAVSMSTRRNTKNTWTPRSKKDPADGDWSFADPDLTATFTAMHRGDEVDPVTGDLIWAGLIGNGHFFLLVDFDDGSSAKFGVNIHFEDPDDTFGHRCVDPV